MLPKASNNALTSTPSFTFSSKRSKSLLAIESFLKLKYSRWMLLLACCMAVNMSSNFSWPFINSVTELLCENLTPSLRNICTMSESEVCALDDMQKRRNIYNNIPFIEESLKGMKLSLFINGHFMVNLYHA